MDFLTDEQWLEIAMYEGGVYAAFESGFSHEDLDPNTSEIRDDVELAHAFWGYGRSPVSRLTKRMETLYDED